MMSSRTTLGAEPPVELRLVTFLKTTEPGANSEDVTGTVGGFIALIIRDSLQPSQGSQS
ncbi:protein of unknown function [Cyanobium sp. NIES-981]|nr:protein of unknown function [Cyanobium sp. NIES-981]